MPLKSERQKRLMEAVAHNPKVAAKTHIPQSVAQEFLSKGMEKKTGKKK